MSARWVVNVLPCSARDDAKPSCLRFAHGVASRAVFATSIDPSRWDAGDRSCVGRLPWTRGSGVAIRGPGWGCARLGWTRTSRCRSERSSIEVGGLDRAWSHRSSAVVGPGGMPRGSPAAISGLGLSRRPGCLRRGERQARRAGAGGGRLAREKQITMRPPGVRGRLWGARGARACVVGADGWRARASGRSSPRRAASRRAGRA